MDSVPFAVSFDTETTHPDPLVARLVTAYFAVVDENGDPIIEQEFLVNPGVEIPAEAIAVHGVTNERAQQFGASPAAVLGDIYAILIDTASLPLLAYNAAYDLTLLLEEARRHASPEAAKAFEETLRARSVIDPHVIDKAVDKYRKGSRKLIHTAEHYGIALSEEDAHGASADALAAAKVAVAIFRRFPQYAPPKLSWPLLHEWQIDRKAEQAASLQSYFRRTDPNAVVSGQWPIQEREAA